MKKWANITQDQFVLNIVQFGLTMEFAKIPVCQFVPPLNFSLMKKLLMQKFANLSVKVYNILNTTREPKDYVSSIFTKTKKDGSYRMILNLKTFTEFLNSVKLLS